MPSFTAKIQFDRSPTVGPHWDIAVYSAGRLVMDCWSLHQWVTQADRPYAPAPHRSRGSWVLLWPGKLKRWAEEVGFREFTEPEDEERVRTLLGILLRDLGGVEVTTLPELNYEPWWEEPGVASSCGPVSRGSQNFSD